MRSVHVRRAGFWVALAWVLAAGSAARAQAPQQTTVCQIKTNPAAYDHKLVQVTAFASHGFENFTLFDPDCQAWPEIWLEYGGTTASGTVYCCDAPKSRKRSKPAEIDGVVVPLTDDKAFHDFDRLIQRPPDSIAHATLAGWFFAAKKEAASSPATSYGHMGCCSLLMIQQVVAVDPQTRTDVDYRTAPDQPTASKESCGVQDRPRGSLRRQDCGPAASRSGAARVGLRRPRAGCLGCPDRASEARSGDSPHHDPGTTNRRHASSTSGSPPARRRATR